MALSEELKKIKHIYGEDFMKLCRENFPTILEDEGALLNLLTTNFANNARMLARDIVAQYRVNEFTDFILGKYNKKVKSEVDLDKVDKTPYEILDEAGYDLYEATTEEELQSYKKYYATLEELCSFHGNRLSKCVCFWAIKKDVGRYERSNYTNPKREDEYSTSVLAIQFNRHGSCSVSIKSRYNHTVLSPDATYGNDLDRIAPGLEASFKKLLLERGMKLQNLDDERNSFWLSHYILAGDGRFYRYNSKVNGAYYCPGNIICRGHMIDEFEPEQVMIIENYVLNLKEKTLTEHQTGKNTISDSFVDDFKDIQKIEREKNKKTGETKLTIYQKEGKPVILVVDSLNRIVEYTNENLTSIGDNFMWFNKSLRKINLPNVEKVGKRFLSNNRKLENLSLPELVSCGADFLNRNIKLRNLEVPKLKKVDDRFLYSNIELREISFPSLEEIGSHFLDFNQKINEIHLPNVRKIGRYFGWQNDTVTEIIAPKLEEVGDSFMWVAKTVEYIEMPNLREVGNLFLRQNDKLEKVSFPNLKKVGTKFLAGSRSLSKIDVPSLEEAGENFLEYNVSLESLEVPNLKEVPNRFLPYNTKVKIVSEEKNNIENEQIAKLDKESKVKTNEITSVETALRWFRNAARGIFTREDRNDDDR